MRLMFKIKPLLKSAETAKEMELIEKELEEMKEAYEKEKKRRQELEDSQVALIQEKNDLVLQLSAVEHCFTCFIRNVILITGFQL